MPSETAGQDHVRIAAGDEGEVAPDLLPATSMVQPLCAGVVLAGREHGSRVRLPLDQKVVQAPANPPVPGARPHGQVDARNPGSRAWRASESRNRTAASGGSSCGGPANASA